MTKVLVKSLPKLKNENGWNDAEWDTGFSSPGKKQKEPLVGNLVDLSDDPAPVAKDGSGWDNEVWANEGDDDEWQSLDIGHSSDYSKLQ